MSSMIRVGERGRVDALEPSVRLHLCHDSTQGYERGFATAFDVGAQGVWTDTFTDFGLLTASGASTPRSLAAPSIRRPTTAAATDLRTDVPRMKAFFEGEIARRGLTEQIQELIEQVPFRFAGLYTNTRKRLSPAAWVRACARRYGSLGERLRRALRLRP